MSWEGLKKSGEPSADPPPAPPNTPKPAEEPPLTLPPLFPRPEQKGDKGTDNHQEEGGMYGDDDALTTNRLDQILSR